MNVYSTGALWNATKCRGYIRTVLFRAMARQKRIVNIEEMELHLVNENLLIKIELDNKND